MTPELKIIPAVGIPVRRPALMPWRWRRRTWALLVLASIVSYPLSFPPACWFAARSGSPLILDFTFRAWHPVAVSLMVGPRWYADAMKIGIQLGLPEDVELIEFSRGMALQFETHSIIMVHIRK